MNTQLNPSAAIQSASEALMYSNGKIYVVVGVIAILLIAVFYWLFTMESRLKQLEQQEEE
jgi:CHASE3 domain sensor protein